LRWLLITALTGSASACERTLRGYGATRDGQTNYTSAIRAAFSDVCNLAGEGRGYLRFRARYLFLTTLEAISKCREQARVCGEERTCTRGTPSTAAAKSGRAVILRPLLCMSTARFMQRRSSVDVPAPAKSGRTMMPLRFSYPTDRPSPPVRPAELGEGSKFSPAAKAMSRSLSGGGCEQPGKGALGVTQFVNPRW
jgi:hypothetical protein